MEPLALSGWWPSSEILRKGFFSTTSDDKVSVKHSIIHVTGFCETRNNRATGVISGVVNPAGAPVQPE